VEIRDRRRHHRGSAHENRMTASTTLFLHSAKA
jgi:hypothetical protein